MWAFVVVGELAGAAMEPRADDGDDADFAAKTPFEFPAAMEPRADDGDDVVRADRSSVAAHAAMEPRADDGDDATSWSRKPGTARCRNGAPC